MAFCELEAALFKIVSTAPSVLDWVTPDRIAPVELPDKVTYPAISFFRVDDPNDFEDLSGAPAQLCRPRVQFDVWANNARVASKVAKGLLRALDGYGPAVVSGLDVVFNAWSVDIQKILKEDARGPFFEGETQSFHSIVDVVVWHQELYG